MKSLWKDLELWVGEVKTQDGKNESHTWYMGGMGESFRGRVVWVLVDNTGL